MQRDFDIRTYSQLLADYELERGRPEYEPVRLGFGTIDAELHGISAGQLALIAARAGVGKTWTLGTVEQNFAECHDAGSLALSLEMPALEWAERALAIHTGESPERVEEWAKQGELARNSAEFVERMRNALVVEQAVRIDELPVVFAHARQRLTVPLRLVLVDYLGLLGSNRQRRLRARLRRRQGVEGDREVGEGRNRRCDATQPRRRGRLGAGHAADASRQRRHRRGS